MLSERDLLANETVLSGQLTPTINAYHVVRGTNVDRTARIDGFSKTILMFLDTAVFAREVIKRRPGQV